MLFYQREKDARSTNPLQLWQLSGAPEARLFQSIEEQRPERCLQKLPGPESETGRAITCREYQYSQTFLQLSGDGRLGLVLHHYLNTRLAEEKSKPSPRACPNTQTPSDYRRVCSTTERKRFPCSHGRKMRCIYCSRVCRFLVIHFREAGWETSERRNDGSRIAERS